MSLNRKNCLSLILLTLVFSSNNSIAASATDPFIQEWDYFDGINTYKLHIAQSPAPGQTYHIDYNFPGGSSTTDMCNAISNNTLSCATGDMVTRDDTAHLVKLTQSNNTTYTFYDPNHMPLTNTIFGNWHYQHTNTTYNQVSDYNISIMKGPTDSEYLVMTSYSDNNGNHCYHGEPYVYQVTKNADGTETITYEDLPWTSYKFKFDPQQNKIVNPKTHPRPNDYFNIGYCITLSADSGIAFTKN